MGGLFKQKNMDDIIFDLKFSQKQLKRISDKAEKDSVMNRSKVVKALKEKNMDGARLYAEDTIRKHKESMNFLVMASRLDAVVSRIQTAQSMKDVSKHIANVTRGLSNAVSTSELEKVERIMSEFEKTFTDLDVRSATMDSAFGNTFSLTTPEDSVMALIKQVADENSLELQTAISGAPIPAASMAAESLMGSETVPTKAESDLNRRLAALRQ